MEETLCMEEELRMMLVLKCLLWNKAENMIAVMKFFDRMICILMVKH